MPTSRRPRGSLADLRPPAGRGERRRIAVAGGHALLIDESYNANPASMRAALAVLGQRRPAGGVAASGRYAGTGRDSAPLHAALAQSIDGAEVDLVFTCGPSMAWLRDALPPAGAVRMAPIRRPWRRRWWTRCGRATSCLSKAPSVAGWRASWMR